MVGFPLGAMDADVKRYETEAAVDMGAGEIDMVMNVGRFKDDDHDYIFEEYGALFHPSQKEVPLAWQSLITAS